MRNGVVLDIKGVHFAYGATEILTGVELGIERGEVMGLVGPNGAGKTTLLSILTGTLKAQRGTVILNGHSLQDLRPRDRARLVAMVPQAWVVPPGFTALELVMMGRNPHLRLLQWEGPEDMEVCHRTMELTDTWELAHRVVSSLSGGEKQRVIIARALAQQSDILLLDEPTAHLDIGYQPAVLDMIERIRREAGITVIAAMHDLTLAAQYCHRIALLHKGAIFAVGEPAEVLKPEVVSEAFGADVCVTRHPVHGTPVVLAVGEVRR